ncbi:MAG: VCBS repeat-containing protein [Phycisphaera sp.]|nr:MAG: VCBS repeat-containing protein [Phycisphaera sp.]
MRTIVVSPSRSRIASRQPRNGGGCFREVSLRKPRANRVIAAPFWFAAGLLAAGLASAVSAQDDSFAPAPQITNTLLGVSSIQLVDIDGDGDLDTLAANENGSQIIWYENDGNVRTDFPKSHVIDGNVPNAISATAADVDDDGDQDIIAVSTAGSGQVIWYQNQGGLPPVFTPMLLGSDSPGDIGGRVNAARAADLDGDTDTDVVVSFYVNQVQAQGHVVWFESDGAVNPSFTRNALQSATGTLENISDIEIGDIDGNGSLDIAAVSETPGVPSGRNRVVWWANNGAANPTFQFNTIDTGLSDPVSLSLADIGGNAALDVVVAAPGSNAVAGFINNGAPIPAFNLAFNLVLNDPRSVECADIDMDGDQDIAVALGTDLVAAIFESNGAFNPGFTQRQLIPATAFCNGIAVGDIDRNGKPDVALSFSGAGRIERLHQVAPIQNLDSGSNHATFDQAVSQANSGESLFIDSDRLTRDPDIDLAGKGLQLLSDSEFVLGDQSVVQLADGASLVAQSGQPIGVDGDVDIPSNSAVTFAGDNGAMLRTSLGVPQNSFLSVATDFDYNGRRRFSRNVIDGDATLGSFANLIGRPVATEPIELGDEIGFAVVGDEAGGPNTANPAALAVYAPDAGSPTGWTGYPVDNFDPATHGPLAVGDLNGDGIDDIATIRNYQGVDQLRIHLGQNAPLPTFLTTTGFVGQSAQHLVSADLDFDGDLDLVTGQGWFRNNGAAVPAFAFVSFPALAALDSFGVVVSDFDLDGARDVIVHCEKINPLDSIRVGYSLYVLWSDANPSPGFTPILIQERDLVASGECDGTIDCYPVANIDLDGLNTLSREDQNIDGHTDFFMSEDDGITLFTNLVDSPPVFAPSGVSSDAKYCNITPADADGDHDIDLFAASQRDSRVDVFENTTGQQYEPGLAIRPVLRATDVAVLGKDSRGVSRLGMIATGCDRVETVDYDQPATLAAGQNAQIDVAGQFIIDNATVSLGDSFVSSIATLIVSPTGRLGGKGMIFANVENAGVVSPNELLDVSGYFAQRSPLFQDEFGSIEINLNDTFNTDQLLVGGVVGLGGGLNVKAGPNFVPDLSQPFQVILADDIDNASPIFDVVSMPRVSVVDQGLPVPGTLVPEYLDIPGGSVVQLIPLTVPELLLGRDDFTAIATPADAVVFDITGGPAGEPDGFADTVIAYPEIPNQQQGGIAVFIGGPGANSNFDFQSLQLFTDEIANNPVAVEAGDFDGDGKPEIAMGNSLNFNESFVYILEADSSQSIPVTLSQLPPLELRAGGMIQDIAVGDFMPQGQRPRFLGGSPIGMVVLTDYEDSGVATAAASTGPGWDSCDVDVCDDPDSVDPIDVDGAAATLIEGYVATSNDDDKIVVASNPSSNPGMFIENSYDVGDEPTEVRADDLDNDGFSDIVVINEADGTVSVLLNVLDGGAVGGRSFSDQIVIDLRNDVFAPDPLPSSVALADLDDDGDLDIAVVSTNSADARVVRQLLNLFVETGEVAFSDPEDLSQQPAGVPLLVREGDLENNAGATALNDDLVVYIDPNASPLPPAMILGFFEHTTITSDSVTICLADVNGDGTLTPADFTAWINAYNNNLPSCDQNQDGLCTPTDFTAWIANYNAGCP